MDSTSAIPQPTLGHTDDAACDVLLVRHGRSADVVPGSADSSDPPLHELGVRQAELLAARLAGRRLDAVYSSHLRRAHATALAVAERHRLPVGIHEDLEEIRLGSWGNGEFRRRAAVRDPEWLEWSRLGTWDGIPGAEADAEFRARIAGVIDTLAARHTGGTIAVVCHGGVIATYLAHLLGIARSMWMTVENTSVSLVRSTPGGPHTVVAVNDCHHLYDPVLGLG